MPHYKCASMPWYSATTTHRRRSTTSLGIGPATASSALFLVEEEERVKKRIETLCKVPDARLPKRRIFYIWAYLIPRKFMVLDGKVFFLFFLICI